MSHNRSKGEVPEEAITRVLDRQNVREQEGGFTDPRDIIRDELAAALPAIRTQLDQEWEERLAEVKAQVEKMGPELEAEFKLRAHEEREREKAEERLKEVERQREEARQKLARVRAEVEDIQKHAANLRRECQDDKELSEVVPAALEQKAETLLAILTQPSSNPLQQDPGAVESARLAAYEILKEREALEGLVHRAILYFEERAEGCREVGTPPDLFVFTSEYLRQSLKNIDAPLPRQDEKPARIEANASSLLSDETIHELTKQIVEGSDGEVISLPYEVVKDALADVLCQLFRTQPEADPEVPGESERTRLWDALRLLAITHFDHERLITDETFDCTDLFCQSTTELLGGGEMSGRKFSHCPGCDYEIGHEEGCPQAPAYRQRREEFDQAQVVWVCEKGHVDDHHYTRNEPGQPELCSRCGGKCEAFTVEKLAREYTERLRVSAGLLAENTQLKKKLGEGGGDADAKAVAAGLSDRCASVAGGGSVQQGGSALAQLRDWCERGAEVAESEAASIGGTEGDTYEGRTFRAVIAKLAELLTQQPSGGQEGHNS
jgi:hypothetical protein